LLLRGAARAREMSVRAALGAGRGRLLRQLLTESAVLAVAGGGAGLLLGWYGSQLLAPLVPQTIRDVQAIRLDGVAIVFTAGLSLLAGLGFGLVPAMHAVRPDLMSSLRTAGQDDGRRGRFLRDGLVIAELALAVMLLVGAGLLGRTFLALQSVDLGFRTDSVVLGSVLFPRARYPEAGRAVLAINDLLTRLRADPAVLGAEATDLPPLAGAGDQDIGVIPVGEPDAKSTGIWYRTVTPGYSQLMKMRLVAGRAFTPEDRLGGLPVGILNEEAARRLFGGKDPIGRQLKNQDQQLTVVGVVANGKPDGPDQPVKLELFFPLEQFATRAVTLVVDPRRDVAAAVQALRTALAAVDPNVSLSGIRTMREQAGAAVALPRLYALLVGIFAAVALGLAILGVYGVMAYAVAQRRREIGVRLALGAAPGAIQRLVLGQGTRLAAIGLGLGLLGATAIGGILKALLFGVTPLDLPTFLGVAALLAAMSLLASLLPARRAMRVSPLEAIRQE
ncbi:MAG: FtsX-like permease family protein, partial [Gemmatimonadales bacterium]|nr:FtsX-like permease family protein [Gemmatimonadales bacterium]